MLYIGGSVTLNVVSSWLYDKLKDKNGKWIGEVPSGFVRDEGYLKPNRSPDYEEGETGYLDIVEALEAIENGESYNATAKCTQNVTRKTLSNIHQDLEHRAWFLDGKAMYKRVQEALEEVAV